MGGGYRGREWNPPGGDRKRERERENTKENERPSHDNTHAMFCFVFLRDCFAFTLLICLLGKVRIAEKSEESTREKGVKGIQQTREDKERKV